MKVAQIRAHLKYTVCVKCAMNTGVVSEYFVTPVETNVEEKVTQTEYNLFKSSKDYTNQRVGKTESRLPEIVKNIALIYVQKGEVDLAISAIKEAREINPDDINLLLSEADLYIKLGDRAKFKELMQLAVEKDPNNAILYYNLGVINGEQGDLEQAKTTNDGLPAEIRLGFGSRGTPSDLKRLGFDTSLYIKGSSPEDILVFADGDSSFSLAAAYKETEVDRIQLLRENPFEIVFNSINSFLIQLNLIFIIQQGIIRL